MQRAIDTSRRIGLQLLDFLYPLHCVLCAVKVDPQAGELCQECLRRFPKNEPPFCPFCGHGNLIERDPLLCPTCHGRPFVFDRAWSAFRYEREVREVVHQFKYREHALLARPLTECLVHFAQEEVPMDGVDVLLPVPLSRRRERERGFNQSALLARGVAHAFGLPIWRGVLVRQRQTPPQIELSKEERARNVAGAFRVKGTFPLQGKRLLLVDDVFTTGATVNACASVLKEAGAGSVSVLTLARGR